MGKKLTDRDLITAVLEQATVVHKDLGEGIIRRIVIEASMMAIDFQMADGKYDHCSDADDFEWAEGWEDYGPAEPRKSDGRP